MPRSLQIFLAKKSCTSVWRGTVELRRYSGLKNTECFVPSRTKTHPCIRRWRMRLIRFTRSGKRELFTDYPALRLAARQRTIDVQNQRKSLLQVFPCFPKRPSLGVHARYFFNPRDVPSSPFFVHGIKTLRHIRTVYRFLCHDVNNPHRRSPSLGKRGLEGSSSAVARRLRLTPLNPLLS